ncbi:hypothetical protein B0O99DRAFT_185385 [Bisporella sp. PMI_857]|nr:hypothetical protein B0O99DRAFT_185385 [Bisporella sp. PMI_857]
MCKIYIAICKWCRHRNKDFDFYESCSYIGCCRNLEVLRCDIQMLLPSCNFCTSLTACAIVENQSCGKTYSRLVYQGDWDDDFRLKWHDCKVCFIPYLPPQAQQYIEIVDGRESPSDLGTFSEDELHDSFLTDWETSSGSHSAPASDPGTSFAQLGDTRDRIDRQSERLQPARGARERDLRVSRPSLRRRHSAPMRESFYPVPNGLFYNFQTNLPAVNVSSLSAQAFPTHEQNRVETAGGLGHRQIPIDEAIVSILEDHACRAVPPEALLNNSGLPRVLDPPFRPNPELLPMRRARLTRITNQRRRRNFPWLNPPESQTVTRPEPINADPAASQMPPGIYADMSELLDRESSTTVSTIPPSPIIIDSSAC